MTTITMKTVEKMGPLFSWRPVALLVMVVAGMAVSGCMSFDQHRLPPVAMPPRATTGTAPSVNLQLVFQATINGESAKKRYVNNWETFRQKQQQELQTLCAKRMQTSGLFCRIDTGTQALADISVKLAVDEAGEFNEVTAFLTGLTLFILPCSAKGVWQMTATVKNNVTGKTAEFQLTDGTTTWIELLLIVGMPFKFPTGTTTHVQERLFDHIIAEMQKTGCVDMTGPVAPPPLPK